MNENESERIFARAEARYVAYLEYLKASDDLKEVLGTTSSRVAGAITRLDKANQKMRSAAEHLYWTAKMAGMIVSDDWTLSPSEELKGMDTK